MFHPGQRVPARQAAQQGFVTILIPPFQGSQGNLGQDLTYFNFGSTPTLIEYDSGGAHYLGPGAVADRAYGPAGQQFAYDVTYFYPPRESRSPGKPSRAGPAGAKPSPSARAGQESTPRGAGGKKAPDVSGRGPSDSVEQGVGETSAGQATCGESFFGTLIHPFQDSPSNRGEDVTYFPFPVGSASTLIEYDAGGAHYVGRGAADRAYGPSGQQVAFDVTYLSGVAVEYTNGSATVLGTDIPL